MTNTEIRALLDRVNAGEITEADAAAQLPRMAGGAAHKTWSYSFPNTIAYSSGAPATPFVIGQQNFWITCLELGLEVVSTYSSANYTQDPIFRNISNLTLQGGGRPYLTLGARDIRILYWATRLRTQGAFRAPSMIGATQTFYYPLLIPFGVKPMAQDASGNWFVNKFDDTAAIKPDPDLTLSITWAANTAMGSGVTTANTTVVRVITHGIIVESAAEAPKYFPEWATQSYAPTQTYSGTQGLVQLNTGNLLRATTVEALIGSPTADVRVSAANAAGGSSTSEIAFVTQDNRRPYWLKLWDFVHQSQAAFQQGDDNGDDGASLVQAVADIKIATNGGVGRLDYTHLADTRNPAEADPMYGLNLMGKVAGTANLGFTVDTATNNYIGLLNEAYSAY